MRQGPDEVLAVAIDTASDQAGVALTQGATLLGEVSWLTQRNHSRELLPALDWLLDHTRRDKSEIGAVFVCLGPGSYAGMRVGLSTAKALAFALNVPIVGVGRLAAEALPIAEASGARVVSVQAAGRAELAWAVYQQQGDELAELTPPRLGSAAELLAGLKRVDTVTGEIDRLEQATRDEVARLGCRLLPAAPGRVVSIARLAYRRLTRGEIDNPDTLVPLYLRAPAIGPQR